MRSLALCLALLCCASNSIGRDRYSASWQFAQASWLCLASEEWWRLMAREYPGVDRSIPETEEFCGRPFGRGDAIRLPAGK